MLDISETTYFQEKKLLGLIITLLDHYISVPCLEYAHATGPAGADATHLGQELSPTWCNNQLYRYKHI